MSHLVRRSTSFQACKLSRHRSGPLTALNINRFLNNGQNSSNSSPILMSEKNDSQSLSTEEALVTRKSEFDDSDSESKINDLENLLFGDGNRCEEVSDAMKDDHHKIIKQSLEIDATCSNLIGDRSKQHILPVIPSAKHTDLYCISPETVIHSYSAFD